MAIIEPYSFKTAIPELMALPGIGKNKRMKNRKRIVFMICCTKATQKSSMQQKIPPERDFRKK
jgi:recombinational DNA repair protein RecR